jgi:hypothetical protein
MLKLNSLQRRLEQIYEVTVDHDVDDFVITDAALAERLDNSPQARTVDEKLLVREQDDNLDLALYLDAELIGRLAQDNPNHYLHDGNLADFCTALEGVSHFLYLTWNAQQGRSVSCIELEMQAEVDKFFTIVYLFGQQRSTPVPTALHSRLFHDIGFAAELLDAERDRYRDANHYAGKYCLQLENRYLRARDFRGGSLLNELRRFYRLSLHHKIRHIESLH